MMARPLALGLVSTLAAACSGRTAEPVGPEPGEADAAIPIGDGAAPGRDRASDDAARADRPTDTGRDVGPPPVLPTDKVMAFPGAEGFGAETPGGRGGKIIEVLNLNDDGPGSFRAAVRSSGPRIVVFRVSGTITMASDIEISGDPRSHLTIAGQTSPGGIQLKGPKHGLTVSGSHDIVIRHLRIRPGGTDDGTYITNASVTLIGGATDVVVDHSSLMWQNHKQVVTYHAKAKATFQWNIIAEGSNSGPNSEITSGPGFILGNEDPGEGDEQISFHHNLVAHLEFAVSAYGERVFDARNNLIFDYAGEIGSLGSTGYPGTTRANFVNNHVIPGPRSKSLLFYMTGGAKLFAAGNWSAACRTGCADDWKNGFGDGASPDSVFKAATAFPAPAVAMQPTGDVKDTVLAYAGANRPRDSVDARIVGDVMSNHAGFDPNKQGRGPWPVLTGPEPPADGDHDGMPDAWEMAHGLDPAVAADGPAMAKNHYTNVENYLNELAGDPVP